jgi:hypothetical protein
MKGINGIFIWLMSRRQAERYRSSQARKSWRREQGFLIEDVHTGVSQLYAADGPKGINKKRAYQYS